MDDYHFNPSDAIDARERFAPPKVVVPKVDEPVTRIVGKKVFVNDPRLISLIVRWKKRKNDDSAFDNFLHNQKFIEELKKVFV